jgi:RNA polymerase sigma factor (sigma-70 family)
VNAYAMTSDICTMRTLNQTNDEMLVASAQSGEKLAFVELWNRHSARTFKTVFRITRNREDAEDALQDSFLKAYLHLKNFDGRSKFSTWLTRIAINTALMKLRRKRTFPEVSLGVSVHGDAQQQWEIEDRSIDIEAHYIRSERAARLRQAILRLRPGLRKVIQIQQMHDIPMKDVAEHAGISVAATKSRMLRARNALRRSLR